MVKGWDFAKCGEPAEAPFLTHTTVGAANLVPFILLCKTRALFSSEILLFMVISISL